MNPGPVILSDHVQLKSEVYIHLRQIHLNSVFHNLIVEKFPVLGQLGSPVYFKNVKCQSNSRVFQYYYSISIV